MDVVVEEPRPEDAREIARVLLAAWLETYPDAGAGVDEAWIQEHRGGAAQERGVEEWRGFLREVRSRPDLRYCRVVRDGDGIAGFVCGVREEPGGVVGLGPMYVLRRVQGRGVGAGLMEGLLGWAGGARVGLWVTAYNERAVRFYRRYGFVPTGERQVWRGRLPNLRMERPAGARG